MALAAGMRLGPYEILAPLGAGGMGEVYRARDTRLNRVVALKTLAHHLSSSPELKRRFEREARMISSLSHPHICTLFDVGQEAGLDFLVMEYLEGETLAHRLARGYLSPEHVLQYGIQIADALEQAHRRGVIHRDLKPGNIMLTKSGVKLLDFGLAKLAAPEPSPVTAALFQLATEDSNLTDAGVIMGTFQYMSPEQLEGKEADARTDIFALGAVLYEMATGKPSFTGKSRTGLIASILSSEPASITVLQPMTPPGLDRAVKICLAKDPDERWQTAHDFKLQLKGIAEGGSQAGEPLPLATRRRIRERTARALLMVATVGAVLLTIGHVRRAPAPPHAIRFTIEPPPDSAFGERIQFNISRDGSQIAYVAYDPSGKPFVWVRPIDSFAARQLAGTAGANFPSWFPDSRTIAFFADGKLQKISASGGPPEPVCKVRVDRGASWNHEGVLLVGAMPDGPIRRISVDDCVQKDVTGVDSSKHFDHAWPSFLPDGHHFLYSALSLDKNHQIWVSLLDSRESRLVLRNASDPTYVSGYLLFDRNGIVMAQPFDPQSFRISGEAQAIVEHQLVFAGLGGWANYSASETGTLVYQLQAETQGQLSWFDSNGREIAKLTEPGYFDSVRISPDGRRLLASGNDPQTHLGDVWSYDLGRRTWIRLTFNPTPGGKTPIWSRDGTRMVFMVAAAGGAVADLYEKTAVASSEAQLLLHSEFNKQPTDWSPDGRFVLFENEDPQTGIDLWTIDLQSHKASPVARTKFDEKEGRFAPDGKWLAYTSDESGVPEVYVQPFPRPGEKIQVSRGGGSAPEWRGDGKQLYYISPESKLMAANVKTAPSLIVGAPQALFALPKHCQYEVAPDGRRFLVNALVSGEARLYVVLNWTAGLKGK